jgi:uncharacterized protein YbjQ (UPF0145 family)
MLNKKKSTKKRKSAGKKIKPKRKVAAKVASKHPSLGKKKKFSAKRRRVTSTGVVAATVETVLFLSGQRRETQSGDSQGLSDRLTADPESLEELVEEGNALEAEAVQGVERAPDADQVGVHTREVPEDDVPEEYL